MLLIVTIALLPIVLVSILQGIERVQRDVNDVRAQLTQSARASADDYKASSVPASRLCAPWAAWPTCAR